MLYTSLQQAVHGAMFVLALIAASALGQQKGDAARIRSAKNPAAHVGAPCSEPYILVRHMRAAMDTLCKQRHTEESTRSQVPASGGSSAGAL